MTRRRWLLVLGALLLFLLGYGCLPTWMAGPKVTAKVVVRRDILQTLVVNGRVLAPRRVSLGLQQTGVVARRLVEEGDRVKAGQLLLQLEDAETLASLGQAQARLDQVRQVSDPASQATLKQTEASLAQAALAFQRAQRLAKDGIFSESQMDEARTALAAAQAAREGARVQARSAGEGADLRAALAGVAAAQARQEQMRLRAPADGVILTRSVEKGDAVQPAKVLFTMALDEPVQLLIQPDEKHLAQLATGQKALASTDAFPQDRFSAEVWYIAPSVDAQRGTVDVKLRVSQPPPMLRADMTVSVELEQGHRSNAITVPVAALRGLPGSPHVLVRRGGRAVKQSVQLGLRGETDCEILDGLQPGDVVITEPSLKPGTRVRVRLED